MLKKTFWALIILVLLLASCGGGAVATQESMAFADSNDSAGDVFLAPMESETYEEDKAGDYELADTSMGDQVERMVIRNADLSIVTENPAQSLAEISQMAESMGGFVVESNLSQQTLSGGGQVPYAAITVRVPAAQLDAALSQITAGAIEVQRANISGQDVTSQYTDLESQLRNLESAEAQLQTIMEDATETEDVLNIFNQLVAVRGQIEVIKGQMQYYEQAAALSRISVSITADEAVQPIQVGGWQPSGIAKDAIETLIKTLQFIAGAGIWLVLCVLPIGLLIGLPLFFIVRAVIRARRRKAANEPPSEDA